MDFKKIGFVTGLTAEAKLPLAAGFMAKAGGGTPAGAASAAQQLLRDGATALVSFGLAGGLNPILQAGTLVLPRSVISGPDYFQCDPEILSWLGGASCDAILAGETIAATVAAKTALFTDTKADAVDLESGAVARVAASANIPFAVLRAISDPAHKTLPPAALSALNAAGSINIFAVLSSIFQNPAQIPSLIALGQDTAKANAALRASLQRLKAPTQSK